MADPRYQSKQHSTSKRPVISGRNSSFYRDDENEELEEAQEKYDYDMDEDDEDQEQEDDQNHRYSYRRRDTQPQQQQQQQQQQETDDDDDDDGEDEELDRQPKKRKLKSLMEYELAPRSNSQPGGSNVRNSSTTEWSERETFALLEAWGNRYLELGRKSIRSEDWVEVAEKVSEVSKTERLDTQCRNRLDTLKKKYKKEKAKMNENGGGGSRWVYFKKMDMLMAISPKQECGLACGVDSGEYVFMNPKVYLNCANGFDEMRDSPANSESFAGNEDNDEDDDGDDEERSSSVRMLAESIQKFSTIYEKIENSKRQQMMELEKMRLDFHNELELQNKQLLERVQTEIEKIHKDNDDDDDDENRDDDSDNGGGGGDDDDNDDSDDASAENLSV